MDYSNLSTRQQEIMQFIKKRISTHGYPPSVREIGEAVGLKSSSTVHSHIITLEEKGFLTRDPSKPRSFIPVNEDSMFTAPSISIPVLGDVAAGSPILAEENIDHYLPIPEDFIGYGNYFVLKVKGESMIEAGIIDGDYIIVREQKEAANGEIVVALLEDEATVKRFYKRADHIELKPENSAMDSIKVQNPSIIGKVTGLLRKM